MGSQRPVRRGAGAGAGAAIVLSVAPSAAFGFDLVRRGFFFAAVLVLAVLVEELEFCAETTNPAKTKQLITMIATPSRNTLLFLTIVPPLIIREHFKTVPENSELQGEYCPASLNEFTLGYAKPAGKTNCPRWGPE